MANTFWVTMRCATIAACMFLSFHLNAQSTFNSVRNILNTHCTGSCHTVASPDGDLVLVGTDSDVYNNLVMKMPANAVASNKGDVLAMPGHPERSFILRKLNGSGWESHTDEVLDNGEGDHMPLGAASLKDEEVELIRQWILFGCPDTGTVVDTQVLYQYYNGMGAQRVTRPTAPDPSLGFQIRFGPFFVGASSELEYNIKYSLQNTGVLYVDKLDLKIHPRMHHFIIEKFLGQIGGQYPEGFRPAFLDTSDASTTMVISVQFPQSVELPEGAAYFWNPGTDLDLNGHAANIYPDSVLAIEAYVNVYYDAPDPSVTEMYSVLAHYSNVLDRQDFFIAPGTTVTFTDSIVAVDENAVIDIWMLTTHTHKYGLSYNIYERDICGGKGEMLYNGNYNESYSFDQGYFDYEHPPLRLFDVLPHIPIRKGLIHEATFHNYGADTVFFGLTTQDEMMNIFMQYTVSLDTAGAIECVTDTVVVIDDTTGLFSKPINAATWDAYPNPFTNEVVLRTGLADGTSINWQLIDVLGRVVDAGIVVQDFETLLPISETVGKGQYILLLNVEGKQFRKLVQKH